MSNGIFNFNFLALVFSEILEGSQIYTRGPYAPWMPPSGEISVPKASTSQYLIVFLISTVSALVHSEILRGPNSQIYVRRPSAPLRPASGKNWYPRRELYYV